MAQNCFFLRHCVNFWRCRILLFFIPNQEVTLTGEDGAAVVITRGDTDTVAARQQGGCLDADDYCLGRNICFHIIFHDVYCI